MIYTRSDTIPDLGAVFRPGRLAFKTVQEVAMRSPIPRALLLGTALALLAFPNLAAADYLGGITFDHAMGSCLPNSETVTVSIDYKIDEASGGRVYILPYTNGAPTPNYAVSGGPLLGPGTGTWTPQMRVHSGSAVIDHVRIKLVSPDQSETWLEFFVPVSFAYGPNGVFDVVPNHSEYSRLRHGQQLSMTIEYASSDAAGCLVFARPYTNGSPTPGYGASGSALLPQSGSTTQWFSFANDADVDHLRVFIKDHTNTTVIFECFIPFDVHWRSIGVYDLRYNWEPFTSIHNSQNLVATFTIDHTNPDGLRVWMWCTTDGVYSPGAVYQGSILEPMGAHEISRYSRVSSGETDVDGTQFTVGTSSETELEFAVPVDYHYGPHALQDFLFTPASPAVLSNGEHLNMQFNYGTSSTDPVLIFARPAYEENPLYGISSAGSPYYPPPGGSGTFWLTFDTGDHVANSMRFQMLDASQTILHLERFVRGWWAWGGSTYITPVPEIIPAVAAILGPAYPNPFNPVATIPITLSAEMAVRLTVYDLKGRLVSTLHDGALAAGDHAFSFKGEGLASGAYICRMETPMGAQTQRMTLVK
jgi:hypothetical protein